MNAAPSGSWKLNPRMKQTGGGPQLSSWYLVWFLTVLHVTEESSETSTGVRDAGECIFQFSPMYCYTFNQLHSFNSLNVPFNSNGQPGFSFSFRSSSKRLSWCINVNYDQKDSGRLSWQLTHIHHVMVLWTPMCLAIAGIYVVNICAGTEEMFCHRGDTQSRSGSCPTSCYT